MEKYYLPVLFTDDERRRYAEWGIKKEKCLIPFAILTIAIDIIVLLETAAYFLRVMDKEPHFLLWLSTWGDAVVNLSYGLAIVFTALLLKPLDMILDRIYKKPNEPKQLCLSPGENGVSYILTQNKNVVTDGSMSWNEWKSSVIFPTNEVCINGERLRIGANTIENIYPKEKQHQWMDRPEEKIANTTNLEKISKNFEGYLASLEEKEKRKNG